MATRGVLDLGSWCILRMASADTLKVARSLDNVGLEVWTPTEKRFGRKPRSHAQFERDAAILPSYVFGRVEHLPEIVRLSVLPGSDFPRFTVFRYNNGIPLIADDQLEPLREIETRRASAFGRWKRQGMKRQSFTRGTRVTIPGDQGAYAGLSGIVEGTEGKFTLVAVELFGRMCVPVKVASMLLDAAPCDNPQDMAEDRVAARAA